MEDPLDRLTKFAGAVVGAVGLVYLVGAISLSLRYEGLGLPGQQTAAYTPRETLLAAGLRTLLVWAALGVAVALALNARDRWLALAIERRLRTRAGQVAVVVIAVALLFVRVLWPLVTLGGVLMITYATVRWESAPVRRALITTLAVSLVAVAYEADRITYYVEWACVTAKDPAARPCGVLVGQQDRGVYLGVSARSGAELLFVPASRVASATTRKQLARVDEPHGEDRREPIVGRFADLRVR